MYFLRNKQLFYGSTFFLSIFKCVITSEVLISKPLDFSPPSVQTINVCAVQCSCFPLQSHYFYNAKSDYFRLALFTAVISVSFSSQSGAAKLAKVGYEGAIGHHCFNSIFIPENYSF